MASGEDVVVEILRGVPAGYGGGEIDGDSVDLDSEWSLDVGKWDHMYGTIEPCEWENEVHSIWCEIWSFGYQAWSAVSGMEYVVSGMECMVSGMEYVVSGMECVVSGMEYVEPGIDYVVPAMHVYTCI